jgi:hypothetical protein
VPGRRIRTTGGATMPIRACGPSALARIRGRCSPRRWHGWRREEAVMVRHDGPFAYRVLPTLIAIAHAMRSSRSETRWTLTSALLTRSKGSSSGRRAPRRGARRGGRGPDLLPVAGPDHRRRAGGDGPRQRRRPARRRLRSVGSRLLRRLGDRGLIELQRDAVDRRYMRVRLTPAGQTAQARSSNAVGCSSKRAWRLRPRLPRDVPGPQGRLARP